MEKIFIIIFILGVNLFAQNLKELEDLILYSSKYSLISSINTEIPDSNLAFINKKLTYNILEDYSVSDLINEMGIYDGIKVYRVRMPTHIDVFKPKEIYWAYNNNLFTMIKESEIEDFINKNLMYCNSDTQNVNIIVSFYELIKYSKYDFTDYITEELIKKYPIEFDEFNKLLPRNNRLELWKIYKLSRPHSEETLKVKYIFDRNYFKVDQELLSKIIK